MDGPSTVELANRSAADLETARGELIELLVSVDARYLFAAYARLRICDKPLEAPSKYFRPAPVAIELAASLIFPFFDRGTSREPGLIQQCIDALEKYQKAYAFAEMFPLADADEQGPLSHNSLGTHLRLHSSTVRGTAYPIQVWRRIQALFRRFESQLQAQFGIGPLRAAEIAKGILLQMEENLNSGGDQLENILEKGVSLAADGEREELDELGNQLAAIMEDMGDKWVPSFDQIARRVDGLKAEEWSALFDCIGLTSNNHQDVTTPVDIQDRPVFLVHPDRAFAAQGTAVLDAIFHFFDKHIRSDQGLVDSYVQYNADWMEERIVEFLRRLFPAQCVIANACYPNPDRAGDEAETDAIVIWGPILVVAEAKGALVSQTGFRGSPKDLKKAVKNNVQNGFAQAERVIRALEKEEELEFKEKATGRTVKVRKGMLRRVMPLSVTLQHLMGIPTQLAVTQRLGLFKSGAYPWSVCIDDLDVITQFAGAPEVFLHYIERRIAHQSCDVGMNADELDIFGHYLDTRLHPGIYEQRPDITEHDGPRFIAFHGGEERFDPFYTAEWYGEEQPGDTPRLDIPDGILSILQELRNRQDDGARFIAFALLGLSYKSLLRVCSNIEHLREAGPPVRGISRTTFFEDGVVVNVMAHAILPEKEFFQNILVRSRIEHYRAKAQATVSIGINLKENHAFQVAQWLEGEWESEAAMEKIIEEDKVADRGFVVPKGGKKPGRNSACPCGSSLKFKKCCWSRMVR